MTPDSTQATALSCTHVSTWRTINCIRDNDGSRHLFPSTHVCAQTPSVRLRDKPSTRGPLTSSSTGTPPPPVSVGILRRLHNPENPSVIHRRQVTADGCIPVTHVRVAPGRAERSRSPPITNRRHQTTRIMARGSTSLPPREASPAAVRCDDAPVRILLHIRPDDKVHAISCFSIHCCTRYHVGRLRRGETRGHELLLILPAELTQTGKERVSFLPIL